jgi:hypothetical protein
MDGYQTLYSPVERTRPIPTMEPLKSMANARAAYGKACNNCARVKSRCIYPSGAAVCERCHRLGKDCQPSTSIRKQNAKNRPASRTAQIEERLDDIVSLLRVQAVQDPAPARAGPYATPSATPASTESSVPTPQYNLVASSSFPSNDGFTYSISGVRAEQQLNTFRQSFLPFFPFVFLPAETTSAILRLQKPFLWLVIMSLTTKNPTEQVHLDNLIRRYVADKTIFEQHKSIDLLLGFACYLNWSVHFSIRLHTSSTNSVLNRVNYHKKRKPYFVMWTSMAVALVFELGIHRNGCAEVGQMSAKADWMPPVSLQGPTRTLEERRAVLGVYIVSSM